MSNDNEPTYSYDPFSKTAPRWGHKGVEGSEEVPVIEGYEIRDKIGSGGMATVWSALYMPLNQVRAVKVLDSTLAADRSFVKRFQDEAKALGRLEHPNIVKVFDANAEHNPPYIAMQWVEGKALSQMLGSGLGQAQAIRIFEQVADALDHAHSMGFTHRDLKPSNVMVTAEGKAMLIDFGVATLLGRDISQGHSLTGTTRYLSPEVIDGRVAGSASDRWALAVMICRVFAGALPFDDPNPDAVLKKIVADSPNLPSQAPARLRAFLVRALEKDPAKRYKTSREMVAELKSALQPIPFSIKGDNPKLVIAGAMLVAIVAAGSYFGAQWVAKAAQPKPVAVVEEPEPIQSHPMRSPSAPPPAEVDPRLKALQGPWFGDLGTRFAEGAMWPTTDGASLVLELRSDDGLVPMEFSGGFDPEASVFSMQSGDGTNLELTATADGSQLRGAMTTEDAEPVNVRFVRAKDVATTPFRNEALGVQMEVPSGWKTTPETVEGRTTILFAPIGGGDAFLRLISEPDDGETTLLQALESYEEALKAAGTTTRSATNEQASLGGRGAVSMTYRFQAEGKPPMQGTVFVLLRQNKRVVLEAAHPVESQDLWQPLVERLVASLRFLDPPVS